ncbi:MAG: hypothetical protein GYA24_09560, partial [Candidatus Lokiarchaeota archaeon]|nr:hypothetical protein [Candidatus Lokiarchaeota archaeon]
VSKNSAPKSIVTLTPAAISVQSITFKTSNGTIIAGMSFVIRVTYRNTGGSGVVDLTTALHFGHAIYTVNGSGLIAVPAGGTGYQDFNITVWAGASGMVDYINASWDAVEKYSDRPMGGGSGAVLLPISIYAQANLLIAGISYTAVRGFYDGALFNVNVTISNTGGARATLMSCTLVPSVPGKLNIPTPSLVTINGGTVGYVLFTGISVSGFNVTIIITANFTAKEWISGRDMEGVSGIHYLNITIPAPSNVFIVNATILSPLATPTYNAGETFTMRVWFRNTGGLDGTRITVGLTFNGYAFARTSWTSGEIVVPANGMAFIDVNVTIDAAGPSANISIYISWSGREGNSNDPIDGSYVASILVQIIALPQVNPVSVFMLASGLAGVLFIAALLSRPKKIKEQIVPGKKKTCKQCGKYVKPYASSCPYCGYKLAEEETMADAMNKLSHLFIFHEESGVCLYYHPFTDAKIDPQLISGFLSAITSFGGQFEDATSKKKGAAGTTAAAAKKSASDLKELVYKEYRILMETSGPCKFAVLITGQTSKILSFKISQFIKHFMRTYEEAFKDWKGNVRIFKDVEKMVRLIFGLTKVQPEGAKPALPGKPPAEEGAPATTGPKAPPPGYGGGTPPPKPVKPAGPAPMKPSLPPAGMATPQAAPVPKPTQPPAQQAQPIAPASSAASSLFALKEQIGAPGEFTPSVAKPMEKLASQPPQPPELDKKDKKKGKK